MNAHISYIAKPITYASDIRLGDWNPADRFRCLLTGITGTLKFDSCGRPWLVTGRIGRMVKADLKTLVLEDI